MANPQNAPRSPSSESPQRDYPRAGTTIDAEILAFDLEGEVARLRQEPPWSKTGRNAKTLLKLPDFRVVLVTIQAGTRIDEHRAEGSITIHALSGKVRVHLPSRTIELPAGRMLALAQAVAHDVEAVEDSVFLLSIAWKSQPGR